MLAVNILHYVLMYIGLYLVDYPVSQTFQYMKVTMNFSKKYASLLC